ncbi:MAG: 4Fe-4S binding protein [Armatimonadota bacterium]|nr:MAG: 4Fe-4S binding protein [Armatimonadota bacterium]
MRIEPLRNPVQLVLALLLNFTLIGGLVISPFLPILRFATVVNPFLHIIQGEEMHLCPLGTIGRCLTATWPLALLLPVLAGLVLVGLLFGRALCGWACPFGLIQDLFDRVRILRFDRTRLAKSWHERLSGLKYVLLTFFALLALAMSLPALANRYAGSLFKAYWPDLFQANPFCAVCFPMDASTLATLMRSATLGGIGPYPGVQLLVLAVFLAGSCAIPRFWCRYACWVGATSSLFNHVSLLRLRKRAGSCTKCGNCARACPMQCRRPMDEDREGPVTELNCVFCLKCVESCPNKTLSLCAGGTPIYQGGRAWWKQA